MKSYIRFSARWYALLLMLLFSTSAIAASFYTVLSQSFGSSGSATTTHTFTLPANQKVASSGYVKIELTGDFDATNEYADISIEGTSIGRATGGAATCTTNLTKNFTLSQANLEKWASDGKIVVTVTNSSAVSGCTSAQRKHGVALSVSNLVSSQPAKTLSKVRLTCPSTITEGATGSCSALADLSDGSSQTVTSSVTNWRIDKAGSISSSGVITAGQVSADQFATITGDYTYNGKTMTGIGTATIKDNAVSGLRSFRISCPATLNENSNAQCHAYATIDGTERTVSTSSTWSVNASSYASINTSGVLVTKEIASDSGVNVKASYTYSGVTKAAEQMVTVKDVPVSLTSISISCPSSIDESSTANCTATANVSNGTTANITNSVQWTSNSTFAFVDTKGVVTTKAVTTDQILTIGASFVANAVIKTATTLVTIKKKSTNLSAVGFTNRSNNQALTANANTSWTLSKDSIYNTGGYKICETAKPTYCLNIESGVLQSSQVLPGWFSMIWMVEDAGNGYISIRNRWQQTQYIYLNNGVLTSGVISASLAMAQWKQGAVTEAEKSLVFTNKSNSVIRLTVGGNSEWILAKDTVYLTDAYKICEKTRPTYCLHIEYSDTLQDSQIQSGWYSALWTIEKFSDGSFFIRSKWKPNKYIVVNNAGATLVNDKIITTSSIEKLKNLFVSIPSIFISNANADVGLYFGSSLINFLKNASEDILKFKSTELWNGKEVNTVNNEKLDFPFDENKEFYICQGYNGTVSHQGNNYYAFDLTNNPDEYGGSACWGELPNGASKETDGEIIRAPTKGTISYIGKDTLCLNIEEGLYKNYSVQLGHANTFSVKQGQSVGRNEKLGVVESPTLGGGPFSHLHMALFSNKDCLSGSNIAFGTAFNGKAKILGSDSFQEGVNFNDISDWRKTIITR